MRSETNGHLQVQVPTKGGGFGANYVLTRVCTISGLEKPLTRVCGLVSKDEQKGPPSEPSTYHILPPQILACPHDNCIDE